MDKVKKEALSELLKNCGILNFGVTDFSQVNKNLVACRAKNRIPANAKSVIVAVFPYLVRDCEGNLSRYAQVPDYHVSLLPYLSGAAFALANKFGCNTAYFTGNSPIPEVYAAACAGLGMIGDNGLLITQDYGSYVFIGEIVTDLQILTEKKPIALCSHCGRCRSLCPAHVLPLGDKGNCLSSITQKKGDLTPEQLHMIRENKSVWGCDLCQTACPHNQTVSFTTLPAFIEGHRSHYHPGENSDHRAYDWRPRSVIDRNFHIIFGT